MSDTTSPLSPDYSAIPPAENASITPPMAPPASASPAATGMGGGSTSSPAPGSQPVPVSTAADNTSSLLRSGMGAPPPSAVSNSAAGNAANNIAPPAAETARDKYWSAIGAGHDAFQKATDPNQSQPGSIWRTILSAALVGAAAGAGHGWKGMGEGAKAEAAVMDRQQKLKQQQFENERQKQKDALEQTKEQREKTRTEADIAMHHQTIIQSQATIDHMTRQEMEEHNKSSQAMLDAFRARGATAPTDPGVPPVISAYGLRDRISKGDKDVLHPLDTTKSRIFFDTVKHSEITQNEKHEWVDKNGALEDMTNNVQLQVLDVPTKTLDTKSPMSFKDLATIAGERYLVGRDPEATVAVSGNDLLRLAKDKRADDLAERQVKAQELAAQAAGRANNLAAATIASESYGKLYLTVHGANEELKAQAAAEIDPVKRQEKNDEINKNNRNLLTSYYSAFPHQKGQAWVQQAPPPPAAPDTSTASGLLKTVVGYAPRELQPVVETYIKGGSIAGKTVPAADNYHDYVSNLSQSQLGAVPEANKLSPEDFQKALDIGKSYYDNLGKVEQRTSQDSSSKKLAAVRARNPSHNATEKDLDQYDERGELIPPNSTLLQ